MIAPAVTIGQLTITAELTQLTKSILTKTRQVTRSDITASIIERDRLRSFLSHDENAVIDYVYTINPRDFGVHSPYLGPEPATEKMVCVPPQPYLVNGQSKTTRTQHLPAQTLAAFTQLSTTLEHDLGHPILISSSYRSDAFQALVFLSMLEHYNFDLRRAITRAAIPGYSEHGTPSRLAIDIRTVDGRPDYHNPSNFADSLEFQWLSERAADFDFYLSFPEGNEHGLTFEPWHWRHMPA